MSTMTWKPGEPIFDLEGIKADLAMADPQDNLDGDRTKSTFLGTVFGLTPSGKFYTPWAASNVNSCPRCYGRGQVGNPHSCKHYHERNQRKASRMRQQAMREFGPWVDGKWPKSLLKKLERVDRRIELSTPTVECPYCHGVGSREAWLDGEWYEQAEQELGTIGASLTSGEGDPCDLFAVTTVEDEELEEVTA